MTQNMQHTRSGDETSSVELNTLLHMPGAAEQGGQGGAISRCYHQVLIASACSSRLLY